MEYDKFDHDEICRRWADAHWPQEGMRRVESKEKAMNKPLTKERRAEIEFGAYCANAIPDLLEAEAYWREAVKNSEEWPSDRCAFCTRAGTEHKPDCPWLLAQD